MHGVLDDQPAGAGQQREAVLWTAEGRHPALGRRDQEGQGHERHHGDQDAADGGYLRQPRVQGDHQPVGDDHGSEAVRERVRSVTLVPLPVGGYQLAFPVHVLPVLPGRPLVGEAHACPVRSRSRLEQLGDRVHCPPPVLVRPPLGARRRECSCPALEFEQEHDTRAQGVVVTMKVPDHRSLIQARSMLRKMVLSERRGTTNATSAGAAGVGAVRPPR